MNGSRPARKVTRDTSVKAITKTGGASQYITVLHDWQVAQTGGILEFEKGLNVFVVKFLRNGNGYVRLSIEAREVK